MEKISRNIKTIIGAGLLALALIGTVISVSQVNEAVETTATLEQVDLDKSISVLP
ncbi:MAG: hypothetical protein AAF696_23795 [Bacteroidota bacterium]